MRHRLWLFVAFLLVGLLGCAGIEPIRDEQKLPSWSIARDSNTWLGARFSNAIDQHPDQTGALLLDRGEEALLWRGALADVAEKSIDAQYFIWFDDNVGTIASERLLRAAERGVRVRVLVDDFPLQAKLEHLVWLDAHPNIEIRVYNPVSEYQDGVTSMFAKGLETFRDFARLNRRMHNKQFIVDGTVAIIGGRNIADEYFDMREDWNFRDRDVLVTGSILPKLAYSFDTYWNSPWVASIERLTNLEISDEETGGYYQGLHAYAAEPNNFPVRFYGALSEINQRLQKVKSELSWGRARLVFDIPGKNPETQRLNAYGRTGEALTSLVSQAQEEVLAETPYMVVMPGTMDVIEDLRSRNVKIRLLTNSAVSNDNMVVFTKYAMKRKRLLSDGVELHEVRPDAESRHSLLKRVALNLSEPDLSLHAKTVVVDRKRVFIGSFNLDPRSTHLNTEMGLIFDNPGLAKQVVAAVEKDMQPQNSYQLALNSDGQITWRFTKQGALLETTHEPGIGLMGSLKMFLFSLFPIKPIL